MDSSKRRLYVGNISPQLAERVETLSSRFAKFGTLESQMELHTKAISSHYFAYVDVSLSNSNLEKLKQQFKGVVFMGSKLVIAEAKPTFDKVNRTPDQKELLHAERLRIKRDTIVSERNKRIRESQAKYPTNSVTGALITNTFQAPINSSYGYLKSSIPPSKKSLNGSGSYSSLTQPESSSNIYQHFHLTSGKGEVVKGRHRLVPRKGKEVRNATYRINVNGELKQLKSHKTKVWGFQKRAPMDLTFKYQNGIWVSGNNHIIERNDIKRAIVSEVKSDKVETGEDKHGEEDDDDENENEQLKNNKILSSLLSGYEFDKPLGLEEGVFSDGESDYEYKGMEKSDDEDGETGNYDLGLIEEFKKANARPEFTKPYDEDDAGNIMDMDFELKKYTTEGHRNQYDEEHQVIDFDAEPVSRPEREVDAVDVEMEESSPEEEESEEEPEEEESEENEQVVEPEENEPENDEQQEAGEDDKSEDDESDDDEAQDDEAENDSSEDEEEEDADNSSEEEFIPSFGGGAPINDTETLRKLFNPKTSVDAKEDEEHTGGFKLALSDEEDIDTENNLIPTEKQQSEILAQTISIHQTRKENKGLFWNHESPFLVAQTQLNKLDVTDALDENYEKWFWDNRGELNREFRRRRRDLLRQFKKRQNKTAFV